MDREAAAGGLQLRRHHRFTVDEDATLKGLHERFGDDWDAIAEHLPGRNARQVRDRWSAYLAENVARRAWTAEEDEHLIRLVVEHGHKWRLIATLCDRRTDVDVKSHWRVLVRRKQLGESASDVRGEGPQPVVREPLPSLRNMVGDGGGWEGLIGLLGEEEGVVRS